MPDRPCSATRQVALLASVVVWALSLPTHKHSWVDKAWSILPIGYLWHFASHAYTTGASPHMDRRLLAMAALVTVWGVRLTYNFWRKGGYRWTDEDYRL